MQQEEAEEENQIARAQALEAATRVVRADEVKYQTSFSTLLSTG